MDGFFWDEPHYAYPKSYASITGGAGDDWACRCPECMKKFEEYYGYEMPKPEGAFYLFMKTPTENDLEFVEKIKEHRILLTPGSGFGCPGYVRIAYCVAPGTIEGALPGFKAMMEYYKNK